MTTHYFHPVPGSAGLRTAASGADQALERLETLAPGVFERQLVDGEPLGRAVVRDRFVPVLRAVFDELAPLQTPIEQVLYLHLYRHSYGEDRNHCRLARRELGLRIGLSPRRFNRALAGLVKKGHVRLVQRDRRGTLYRVLLPGEVLAGRVGSEVLLGKLRGGPTPGSTKEAQAETASSGDFEPPPSQAPPPRRRAARRGTANRHHKMMSNSTAELAQPGAADQAPPTAPSVGKLVEAVLSRVPARRRAQVAQDVLQDVLDLLEEGMDPLQLLAQTQVFTAGPATPDFARAVRSALAPRPRG